MNLPLGNKLVDTRFRKIFAYFYGYTFKCFEHERYDSYRRKYKVADSFVFSGNGIIFSGDGEIECGENSYLGNDSYIQVGKGSKVVIGKNCRIGPFLSIYTYSLLSDQDFSKPKLLEHKVGDVIIRDNCWIGTRVLLREGIEISENSVIGANSVVTKNIPPHAIAAGVPAKIIRMKSDENVRCLFTDKLETQQLY